MGIFGYGVIGLCVVAWLMTFFGPFFARQNNSVPQDTSGDDDDDSYLDPEINSANGLPMMFGVDIHGNPDGVDDSPVSTFTDTDD
jgi:hypothetical protein